MDFSGNCLICLRTESDENYSIFDADLRTPDMTILEKIRRCSALKLSPEENEKIPNKICSRCLDDLTATWRFRKNVERVNQKLSGILEASNSGLNIHSTHSNEETISLLESEVESHDKSLEADFSDVIVETISEDDNAEMADFEEFDEMYERAEILEDASNDSLDKNIEYTNFINKSEEKPLKLEVEALCKEMLEVGEAENEGECEGEVEGEDEQIEMDCKIDFGYDYRKSSVKICNKTTNNMKLSKITHFIDDNSGSDTFSKSESRKGRRAKKNSTPKICDICGNSYKYQHALNAHMRRHNNDKPFRCEFCDKRFVAGVEMQRHMRVHTGQKPYSCKHCDRKFSDFGSRVKHERTHTGERPYICPTCGKTFAYAHVLTVHLRTHTGEKKFQCTLCEKGFTKKIYLESHLQQHSRCATINTEKLYGSEERDVKVEQFVITEYVEADFMEKGAYVKAENGEIITPDYEDDEYKYLISVQ